MSLFANPPLRAPRVRLASLVVGVGLAFVAGPSPAALPDVPATARAKAAPENGEPRVDLRLVVDRTTVSAGGVLRAGVLATLEEGWHIYWTNPGDGAFATRVELASKQATFGALEWPAPRVFSSGGGEILTHGYEHEVLLGARATVAAEASGKLTVTADVKFLACKVDCIPGEAKLARTLDVGATEVAAPPAEVAAFQAAQAAQPRAPDDVGVRVTATWSPAGDGPREAVLAVATCPEAPEHDLQCSQVAFHGPRPFIPTDPRPAWTFGKPTVDESVHRGAALPLSVTTAGLDLSGLSAYEGVLWIEVDGEPTPLEVSLPREDGAPGAEAVAALEQARTAPSAPLPALNAPTVTASAAASAEAGGGELSLAYVLLLSFLGGLILNLMPCVFPVLAIKVFSFMQMVHESRSARAAHAAAYTAGIVGTMLGLAAVVLGLRASGTLVGWGFQFQSPGFLVLMAVVLVVFAMNLFELFTIGVVGHSLQGSVDSASGLRRSAGEGVLAVALSTPCSAPLLGSAVGFALGAGGLTVVAVFVAIGLGLAAPFVVLTQIPGAAKVLPRPGNWMNHARVLLGFSLLLAVVWILWILGRVVGIDGIAGVMAFLVGVGLCAWMYGIVQHKARTGTGRPATIMAVALSAAVVVGGYLIVPEPAPVEAAALPAVTGTRVTGDDGKIAWRPWTPEAVQEQLKNGVPVFVDFTADWCITCKANEKGVINTPDVIAAMEKRGILPMKADWTRPDERIRATLEKHGKAGVPMYLVYGPKQPDAPQVLPEVLTGGILTEAFDAAVR